MDARGARNRAVAHEQARGYHFDVVILAREWRANLASFVLKTNKS